MLFVHSDREPPHPWQVHLSKHRPLEWRPPRLRIRACELVRQAPKNKMEVPTVACRPVHECGLQEGLTQWPALCRVVHVREVANYFLVSAACHRGNICNLRAPVRAKRRLELRGPKVALFTVQTFGNEGQGEHHTAEKRCGRRQVLGPRDQNRARDHKWLPDRRYARRAQNEGKSHRRAERWKCIRPSTISKTYGKWINHMLFVPVLTGSTLALRVWG